ncbi:MAG: acyltransferase [Deferrisomatales bacterium]|nr:acyltransferase [Deferrisomatales bacterium]
MTRALPGPLRGALSALWLLGNTVLSCGLLLPAAALKGVLYAPGPRRRVEHLLEGIATRWVRVNNLGLALLNPVRWQVEGVEDLRPDDWYLVISNHQSWLDIVVLQRVLAGRVPFLKFFIKQQLIWVPLLGIAWWALDFPFMRRHSREFLERNPHLRGQDLEATRRACERFAARPTAIMNFVEGTRFTPAKRLRQGSPFARLLKPRAGGIAFVLGAMGRQIHQLLDVTIAYPAGGTGFWRFLCGRIPEVQVRVEALPVTPELLGDYDGDAAYRQRFQEWLNRRWEAKDRLLADRAGATGSGPP